MEVGLAVPDQEELVQVEQDRAAQIPAVILPAVRVVQEVPVGRNNHSRSLRSSKQWS